MSEAIQFPETRAKAAEQLADRYMALWNEPDADRRRRMIAELWTEDGSQILQPPQEMREIAASPGIGLAASSRRGTQRAPGAGDNVLRALGRFRRAQLPGARRRPEARRRRQVPREAVANDGSTAAVGLNVLVLAADGRVQRNYTFVDGA